MLQVGLPAAEAGLHPTQKPLRLLQALIALTTCEGQFAGDGWVIRLENIMGVILTPANVNLVKGE